MCTIEKANSIINHIIRAKAIQKYRTVIVDEVHMIGDPKRGYLLELLLNKLLLLQSIHNLDLQIICLSATLPNIQHIVNYTNAVCFVATQRPNQLPEYIIVGEMCIFMLPSRYLFPGLLMDRQMELFMITRVYQRNRFSPFSLFH